MPKETDLGDVTLQKDALEEELDTELEGDETPDEDTDEKTENDDEQDGSEPSDEEEGSEETDEADPEEQRKEIQERLIDQDKTLEAKRAIIKEDWDDLEAAHQLIEKQFPRPVPLNGKPAFLATDAEFEAAEDAILESGNKELLALLKQARAERREYLKKVQALAPRFQKVQQQRTERTMEDIKHIKDALVEISPEYKNHFNEIENLLKEEFEANPARLERFVWGGIRDKFRFIDRLLDESGIKQRVEKEIRNKERPNLAAPVGAGKGKRGTPTGKANKRIFTRAEIAAITKDPKLYDKMESEIDKAMMEGRIK